MPCAGERQAAFGLRVPRRMHKAGPSRGSCGVGLGEGGRVRDGGRGTGPSRALGPAGGRERERRAAGRDKANRLPSPPRGRTAPMPLGQTPAATAAAAHSLFISSPPGPSPLSSEVRSGGWSLQKLPRGVLGAVPPRLRGQPSIPGSPRPFPHPDPPPKVPPTLPPRLEAPPTLSPGGRLRLPTSRPPPVLLTFDFSLGSRGDPGATAGKQPKEVAGVRPGRGRNETGRTRSLAPLLPGGAWHQQDLNPGRCVCQAMPGDWMEGIQHDEILCRRMVCGERGLGTKVAGPKRTVGCLPHLFSTWPFRLDERLPWTTKYTAAAPPAA
ncbi:uncharacterized protein LOC132659530 [Ovis aries]|uniref:uncharacterized protein LOC132659530 n=1 Tax=Ovis aries TaxID=9940 RepID=UPI00295268D3|nr:uncharacterized protein LOC132659530 [Ovis aries]